jgi:hypothetical protein
MTMFNQSYKKNTEITLVVFPNLNEFVAVDTRSQLRARPIIHSLDLADIAGSDFANSLEEEFSSIVRRRETGFLGLMGIPGKVENLVRTRAIRNMLKLISQDTDEQVPGEAASVGILFFTGPLLRIDRSQVRELADELFGERLSTSLLNDLSEVIVGLMERQIAAEQETTKSFLGGLISGRGGPYATLWEKRED